MFCGPDTVWYLETGWRYKDVRPSDLAIATNRIVGVVGKFFIRIDGKTYVLKS